MIQLLFPSNSSLKSFIILGIFMILVSINGCQDLAEQDNGLNAACRAEQDDTQTDEEIKEKCKSQPFVSSKDASSDAGTRDDLFAGSGVAGHNDATEVKAQFNSPSGLVLGEDSLLYVSDFQNHVIRKITTAGKVITIAGTAKAAGSGDGSFNGPSLITYDFKNNRIYVFDKNNKVIRTVTPTGEGSTEEEQTWSIATLTSDLEEFNDPSGLAVDNEGILYVADTKNHRIAKVDTDNGTISNFVGEKGTAGYENGNTGARFNEPWGIAFNTADQKLYVTDHINHVIRKISLEGEVTTYVGPEPVDGSSDASFEGKQDSTSIETTAARFKFPQEIAIDTKGTLYILDSGNNTIRKVTSDPNVSTLDIIKVVDNAKDADIVKLSVGIAVELSEDLYTIYLSDTKNHRILKIIELPPQVAN